MNKIYALHYKGELSIVLKGNRSSQGWRPPKFSKRTYTSEKAAKLALHELPEGINPRDIEIVEYTPTKETYIKGYSDCLKGDEPEYENEQNLRYSLP